MPPKNRARFARAPRNLPEDDVTRARIAEIEREKEREGAGTHAQQWKGLWSGIHACGRHRAAHDVHAIRAADPRLFDHF